MDSLKSYQKDGHIRGIADSKLLSCGTVVAIVVCRQQHSLSTANINVNAFFLKFGQTYFE